MPPRHAGALRAARDLLLAHRADYAAAVAGFSWPRLDEFNWALDWFDVIAAEHPDRLALRVVGDDGSDEAVSYAAMAARSAQVANWLRGLGVRRGDHVLLMLGNVVPLWEVMLAAIKLGAVVIPASTLLQPADLADRITRGNVRHVIAEIGAGRQVRRGPRRLDARRRPAHAFRPVLLRRARPDRPGWHRYEESLTAPTEFDAGRRHPRRATRCCSTSPRGPPRSPSWSATPTSATRSATCPPCTGSASSPATCT